MRAMAATVVVGGLLLGGSLFLSRDGRPAGAGGPIAEAAGSAEAFVPGPGIPTLAPGSGGPAPAETLVTERTAPRKGPDLARWYFEQWHHPHPGVLPPAETARIWDEVKSLPEEGQLGIASVNAWECIGPYGMRNAGGGTMTGRVLDLEVGRSPSIRAAAASGGLWEFVFFFPIQMTDDVESQCVSTFSTHPQDSETILIGTGEPFISGGRGLWKKTAGSGWERRPMEPEPDGFFRIRYAPDGQTVHALTTTGYFRSTDGGDTWTRTFIGWGTDLAIHPANAQVLYMTVWAYGLYKSTDAGLTWSQVTAPGIPTFGVTRGAIAIGGVPGPARIYVSFADVDYRVHGVYTATDADGAAWQNVTPPAEYMRGQGWYDNTIGVSPTNNNVVLTGGVGLWRTSDGGASWVNFNSDPQVHADCHAVCWHPDGQQVWLGHDGGWSYSGNAGQTWDTSGNLQPITQYVNVYAGLNDPNVIGGGSQDNGVSITENGGVNWRERLSGDGGGFAVDPLNSSIVYAITGVYGGDLSFRRFISTNRGANWVDINSGLEPSRMWYPRLRHDMVPPVYLFTNSDRFVYKSPNFGNSWHKLNQTAFPAEVHELSVARRTSDHALVYACTRSEQPDKRLYVYSNYAWHEISDDLPAGALVRKVSIHPTNSSLAYAIMNGMGTPGRKVYRSDNGGFDWVNITGDLPDIPVADLIPHPTDNSIMYLGTEFGCFRTTDHGAHWHRWNNGLPDASIVTEMGFLDLRSQNGQFWIVAGTYGRGIWKREISGDDPVVSSVEDPKPAGLELRQNYPNPFRDQTSIDFAMPERGNASLRVFSAAGREVAVLFDGEAAAGSHRATLDASRLPAGAYFYTFETPWGVESKKMMIVP